MLIIFYIDVLEKFIKDINSQGSKAKTLAEYLDFYSSSRFEQYDLVCVKYKKLVIERKQAYLV